MKNKYRIICNEVTFDFHDLSGVELSVAILKRFNIPFELIEL